MKETIESLAILASICVIAAVINEIAGYELVSVDLEKKTIRSKK